MNYFLSLIITDKKKYCLGLGWENDEVVFEITSTTYMRDCYKKLIDSPCDRSTTFSGYEAKYIDECDDSQTVIATVKEWVLYEARED